ncbi:MULTISPECIES: hypothetical protein [Thermomonospora]|uniref:Uncharacterized protein n=1 Tax=Thermomonospora cellulosilytica TaxID=1411118 RepID=A0A7W3R965_9ACTN|nr:MULTISPECIES: hypothetical protein [Thermomonospora]MBA9004304.1 hypothetical protein [Thermomonospora cellulosilytica]
MSHQTGSSWMRRTAATAAVGLTAAAGIVAMSGTAYADTLRVDYPVTGTTYLASTNSTMTLGPGVLKSELDLTTADLTADLELPPAQGQFKQFGVIPVSVTTTFIPEGKTVGKVDQLTGKVTSTSKVTLQLSNLKVAGIPTPVGSHCKTEEPVTISVTSGDDWSIIDGGTLSGTYSIPDFEHCLLATPLINLTVPGDGNTITLKLGAGTLPPS